MNKDTAVSICAMKQGDDLYLPIPFLKEDMTYVLTPWVKGGLALFEKEAFMHYCETLKEYGRKGERLLRILMGHALEVSCNQKGLAYPEVFQNMFGDELLLRDGEQNNGPQYLLSTRVK